MEELLQIGLGLFGGLALFLYGMNLMSSNLQEAAGERMRAILAAVTKNPFFGVLAGALATAVLQSSSATTVMAIGFVAAGLMGLRQAIPIIMGANIGTTITAQIIAFKLSDYVLGIVLVGFLIMQLAKQGQMKYVGTAVFGFGLLFLGIDTMGAVMKPLAENPVFTDLIAQVTGVPVLGVLVGTLMTLVVQSSSATIAVLQNFASTPGADMTPGQMDYTARPLDVALQQDGWLAVQTADGGEGYTRNGNIQVSATGQLTIQGHPVMGEAGPLTVPEGSELTIAADGTISALNPGDPANTVAPVGRLKLVKAEGNEVQRGDDGMFRLTQAAQATRGATLQADPTIRVMSGVLEGSNVKPVEAMTDMIASARRFEMQMKIISSVDENAGKANQLLAMS